MAGREVKVYTDGSVYPNPGFGGWGALLVFGAHQREISGASIGATTNNQMELTAVIEACKLLKPDKVDEVIIVTDSEYIQNGINIWFSRWRTIDTEADFAFLVLRVKNYELWYELFKITNTFTLVRAEWVRGHEKFSDGNNKADELAGIARKAVWEGVDFKEWVASGNK